MRLIDRLISRHLGNWRGESLTSILIAIPVVLTISMLIGTMVYATYKETAKFRAKNSASSLQQDLRAVLDSRSLCAAKFSSPNKLYNIAEARSPKGMDVTYTLDDGTTVVEKNATLVNYGVRVNSLKFKAYNTGGTNFSEDPRIPGNTLHYGEVFINTQKIGEESGMATRDQSLGGVVLSVTPSRTITSCFLLDKGFDLCTESGGTYNASGVCQLPSPCPVGQAYAGDDASGNPICQLPQDVLSNSCPVGMVLVSDGAGGATCQFPDLPPPTPTPTPTPVTPPVATPPVAPGPPGPTPPRPPAPVATPTPTPVPTPTPIPGPPPARVIETRRHIPELTKRASTECVNFLTDARPIDLSATNDETAKGIIGNYYLPKVRFFTMPSGVADSIIIDSAVQTSIKVTSKLIKIRTQYLDSHRGSGNKFFMVLKNIKIIEQSAGEICASAETIETIDTVPGIHHLVAKSIGLIEGGTGTLHIYGATVNTINKHVGDVCLYNGAKVINYPSNNLGTIRTDCP